MVVGKLPFHAGNQEEIYEKILQGKYTLGPDTNPEAASLISNLLLIEPENRLGANSIDELKNHPFFEGVEFDTLWNRNVPDVIEEIKIAEQSKYEEKTNDENLISEEIRKYEETRKSLEFRENNEEAKVIMDGNVQMEQNKF